MYFLAVLGLGSYFKAPLFVHVARGALRVIPSAPEPVAVIIVIARWCGGAAPFPAR